ncbi:hypothetical protein CCR75_002004 [Bremia lactucae]|uniref:EDRF1 N-terminal domain-containing protein n=1 Tax=Bremia lactucae TaxID=4779 RepID=A0A976IGR6_BRELC|nr:hypothetical protein CCR75_002004 [Bremia lactucae]
MKYQHIKCEAASIQTPMQVVEDQPAVASFSLPASPARSPVGSNSILLWKEDASITLPVPDNALDFPLVLWESSDPRDPHSELSCTSSALVPFQKLQLDTNLNQTTLPYSRSRTSSFHSRDSSSNGSNSPRHQTSTHQLASGFRGIIEHDNTSQISQEFRTAMRLGDSTQQEEPQLSVKLRGDRVELASASEEQNVDFLGPAENIKRLFKLPYSHSRVSLAVHRVGKTLIVDGELHESDIPVGFENLPQEMLQLPPESEKRTQQLLYEKFIYESTVSQISASEGQKLENLETKQTLKKHHKTIKKSKNEKREKRSKARNEGGKLLVGINQDERKEIVPTVLTVEREVVTTALKKNQESSTRTQDRVTPPNISTKTNWFTSPQYASAFRSESQTFQRILKWKFNDLKMILGSQVLLFENHEHPAVSLKLHDMDKELSVCTVLDYYLDNVIANIPELALCMHSKGVVRGYKLVETRQIPYMSGTGRPLFDVHDVSMNASMLLKFLQENCSRENGTYWLHRNEGENSLRLYDVDVLSQGNQLKWKYMMAMLCYRFAARASRLLSSLAAGTPQLQHQLQQRQRELLSTCMTLLNEIAAEKGGIAHRSICSSVSEQLADTYLRECSQLLSLEARYSTTADSMKAMRFLEKAKDYLLASIQLLKECIRDENSVALRHHTDRLDALSLEKEMELAPENERDDMASFLTEELHRLELKFSSTCLELSQIHAGSQKWSKAVETLVEASQFLSFSSIPESIPPLEWTSRACDAKVETLLEKLDFEGIGHGNLSREKLFMCSSKAELRCSLLGLIGDMAAQRPGKVLQELVALYDIISGGKREELVSLSNGYSEFLKLVQKNAMSCESQRPLDVEETMILLAFFAYLRALSPMKLGNASNELGKYFLAAKQEYKEAFKWFKRGCKIFSDIEDSVNVALLRANLAHLHKIFAQGKSVPSREEHYQLAVQLCSEAAELLKQSKADVDLHEKVKGELALTYLVWAVDVATLYFEELDRNRSSPLKSRETQALSLFHSALSLYTELKDAKQLASTHYQIAFFYRRMIATTLQVERENRSGGKSHGTSCTLTNYMEIARRHYEKALKYFGVMEIGKIFVLIHQELAELHLLSQRLEGIEHALLILLNTYEAFHFQLVNESRLEKEELGPLGHTIVAKVQTVLHDLIRLCSIKQAQQGGSIVHAKSQKLERFKKMYKEVIYYDGSSLGTVVSILGTLRRMYST